MLDTTTFTFLIVNLKRNEFKKDVSVDNVFTFLIVNLKQQNPVWYGL